MVCHWFNLLLSDSSDTDIPAGPVSLPESRPCPVRYSTRSGRHAHASTLSYSDWGLGRWVVLPRGPLSRQLMLVETQGQARPGPTDRPLLCLKMWKIACVQLSKSETTSGATHHAKGYSIATGTRVRLGARTQQCLLQSSSLPLPERS